MGRTLLVRFNVTNETDKLGVLKIYPTAKDGETWVFNSADPNDGQFDSNGAEISRNQDGSWHVNPGITRMLAFTKSSEYPSDKIRSNLPTYNYSMLAKQGYWYKPSDWKNVSGSKVLSTIYQMEGLSWNLTSTNKATIIGKRQTSS